MHPIRKSSDSLGMAILIGLAVGETVYNTIFHPVKMYKLVAYKRSWY